MKKYRIDDSYKKVYEYDNDAKAYVFIGTFAAFGITNNMSEKRQLEKIERENNMILRAI